MNELLSAAALLIGLVGILYGVWYKEIAEAIYIELPRRKEDARRERQLMEEVRASRAFPLALASSGIALVFMPESIAIIIESSRVIGTLGFAAIMKYDAVRASFLLVNVTAVWLAISLIVALRRLNTRIQKIS